LNKARSEPKPLAHSKLDEYGNDGCGSKIDTAAVSHIQVVTSLIEGRFVGLAEIFVMLDNLLRQRSIVIGGKLFYDARYGQKTPP
jgi:hypothetical protein